MKTIKAYEFLEMTDDLFGKFTSTVGEAVGEGKNIRYKLETKQTLHDFIKKCKDGKNANMQLLKDLNVAEWKNKYIQLMLDRKYSDYLCIFVQSVMFVGNYKEALETMEKLCEQTLDILKRIEITNLERDSALIELILSIHEMYMFLAVQPTKYYDPKTDSLDFGIIDDEDPAF